MVKQKPEWIHLVVSDLAKQVEIPILPSIQVKESYLSDQFTFKTFQKAYNNALMKPSSGIVFWKWDFFEKNVEMKKIFTLSQN